MGVNQSAHIRRAPIVVHKPLPGLRDANFQPPLNKKSSQKCNPHQHHRSSDEHRPDLTSSATVQRKRTMQSKTERRPAEFI